MEINADVEGQMNIYKFTQQHNTLNTETHLLIPILVKICIIYKTNNELQISSSLISLHLTEPCPPTNVSSFMNCLSNIAVVSWTGSAGAEFYTATVTQEDGLSASCWSESEQCGLSNLYCGQNYTVTVVASNECSSEPSEVNILPSGQTCVQNISGIFQPQD